MARADSSKSKRELPCCKACGAQFQNGMAAIVIADLDAEEPGPLDGVYHEDCAPELTP